MNNEGRFPCPAQSSTEAFDVCRAFLDLFQYLIVHLYHLRTALLLSVHWLMALNYEAT